MVPALGLRGTTWLPQGRYLFAGIYPIAILMAWGWWNLLPLSWDRYATVAACAALAVLDVASLTLVVVPYFRGG
jgi:hypothetical protein